MPDGRFYHAGPALSVEDALALAREHDADARLIGPKRGCAARVARPDESDISDAFVLCARKDIVAHIADRTFGLAVAEPKFADEIADNGPVIESSAAKRIFAEIAGVLHHPRLDGGAEPKIAAGVMRHPTAIIGAGAEIGADCVLSPYVVIGPGVKLGRGCIVGTAASVQFAILGDRVRLLAGARLGEDGFGFVDGPAGTVRAPQLGRLIVGDDVEIGANATIDRGALGDTVIGDGTKIDNLVHIAHNVQIGRNCFIAGQAGFAGSCELGDGVMIGGQAGVADHLSVGAGAMIAAQAGVISDMPAGESWGGTPAMPRREWLRATLWAARQSKRKADEK